MFRHISKITASTLKYTSSLFSQYNQDHITPTLIESWLKDMQIGLDALLDDQIMIAEDTFSSSTVDQQSPFHAFGYALLVYTRAMLAMEKGKIEEAVECVLNVEVMLKRTMNTTRKKRKLSPPTTKNTCSNDHIIHSSFSVPLDMYDVDDSNNKQQQQEQEQTTSFSHDHDGLEMQFELLHANCILMSATLQFLRDSWIDNLKAAYDLRKAFKIYERLFETITGVTIAEYETTIIKRHYTNTTNKVQTIKTRRTVSCDDGLRQQQQHYLSASSTARPGLLLYDETVENGAYFGIGLFNVIFSLLPIKVGKILNNLGFHSSRATAIFLLQKSYKSQTMYSPLSSLVLLSFYTNISIYIQPHINQFFHFNDAKCILERMKILYPNGQIWCLIEGKFKKLQGQLDTSIILFKKAKNPPPSIIKDASTKEAAAEDYFRNASITEFVQFRSFAIYELGWTYIYAGDYFQASEAFFCLSSMCNWSRVFYHYISTCCMIADGLFDKAVLEIRQIINMLDQKKKLGGRASSNEQYAESRVRSWIDISTKNQQSLKETLQYHIINPIWELVYLWNGISYWKHEVVIDIKRQITLQWKKKERPKDDPMLCLLMGVIQRDIDKNLEVALECFNLILITAEQKKKGWIIPYAMYEITATHCNILLRERSRGYTNEYKLIISDWISCIENYYAQNTQDNEWETRMQIRCQLLIESCNSI